MTQSIKKFGIGSIAFAALMLLVLPLSFAHASDLGDDGSYDFYPDQSQSSYDFYPTTDTATQPSYDFYPDQTQSYDFYPDQTSSGYSTSGYSTGGYSTGGYSTGGYSTGGGYRIGSVTYPNQTPVYNTPVVTTPSNTCTNNSCNSDDHSVVNITNPAPVINNNNVVANYAQPVAQSYPVQQYCANGYSGTYPNCYRAQPIVYQQPPVAYNNTPYVSLSQVPYTGLDLGFWGSIAYWGAFVLFALFAAYLIAIKRVQNSIAAYLKSLLFGSEEEDTEETLVPAAAIVSTTSTPAVAATNGDVIDSFIMSQINRARA